MRKSVILAFLFFYILTLNAQTEKELIVLDNYTIPTDIEGVIVGRVIAPDNEIVFLNKDTSELFIFDKQNYIRLKDGVALLPCYPQRYEIEMQYGETTTTFELVKDDFLRNGVIANGGAWKNTHTNINSLESLKEAVKLGCEASRCDVWLTADNKVVLAPAAIINDRAVENMSSAELSRIQLDENGSIPLLEECIEYIKTQNRTRLVINLRGSQKNKDKALALAEAVVQTVHSLNAQAWVEYISFDYDILLHIRSKDKTALVSYMGNDKTLETQAEDNMSAIDTNFNIYFKNEGLFDKARELGFTIKVWTVDSRKNMEYFLQNGINYITTDEPEMLLKIVSE